MKYDVLIIGAGPSGIFTAFELIRNDFKGRICILEKGLPVEKRFCPKKDTRVCVNCKQCNITTGFSGAGAFSDGKLSLSYEVGGDLPMLIGQEKAQSLINYTDSIYLEFGADTKIEGISAPEKTKEIRKRAIKSGLKLVDCPIRHMGTEKAHEIYKRIQDFLVDNGVELIFNADCRDVIIENETCIGAKYSINGSDEIEVFGEKVIIATGRKGADWLEGMCRSHGVGHSAGTVDIGVRVEVRNEVMDEVNELLYESKLIGYPNPFRNKVRTFCQNPGGFVSQENYDNNLAVVNGHSYKELKSNNTNLSILCSHNFSVPFNEPIKYASMVGALCNMLGNGKILVQRYGDILDGKRTWQRELDRSNVRPSLPDAVAGDISAAIPYRTLVNILKFIEALDNVVPGFASPETLLYAPEIKFYSNRIDMDDKLKTNIKNLYCLGDSSGWTRGLMMASSMGVYMGRLIISGEA